MVRSAWHFPLDPLPEEIFHATKDQGGMIYCVDLDARQGEGILAIVG